MFSNTQGRSPLNGLLTPAAPAKATAMKPVAYQPPPPNQVTPLPPVDPPMPAVNPLQQTPWKSVDTQPAVIGNQNVWKTPDMRYVSPLSGLLDQSTQFNSVRQATETQDEEPEVGQPMFGGGGFSEATLAQTDYVDPFEYTPYQPRRRYEVL
jgi:hypothetical protein